MSRESKMKYVLNRKKGIQASSIDVNYVPEAHSAKKV
jgi:hypothetical protein